MYHRRQCCPESTFMTGMNSEMASKYRNQDKSCVTWSDTVRPGTLLCPQPPTRDRNNNRQQLVARQYIDYCNGSNGASTVSRPSSCCLHGVHAPHLSREPTGVISLRDVMTVHQADDVHHLAPPVDEEVLIEAVHRATINEYNSVLVPQMKPSASQYHLSRPSSRAAAHDLMRSRSRQGPVRKWIEVCEDEQGHITDMKVIRPNTTQLNRPVTSRPPYATKTSYVADVCRNIDQDLEERKAASDAAKNALMAIYLAGRPDNRFHVRAPSTAALTSMLEALSTETSVSTEDQPTDCAHCAGRLLGYRQGMCQHVSCARRPGNGPVLTSAASCRRVAVMPSTTLTPTIINTHPSHDMKPVKVNVECSPNTDTTVSFRVRSVPA